MAIDDSATVLPVVTEDSILAAAERVANAASSPARVILFGSRAHGDARPGSDVDLLVIERELGSRRSERVRLRRAIGDIGVPVDVLVIGQEHADEWGAVPGTAVHDALSGGRVLVEP